MIASPVRAAERGRGDSAGSSSVKHPSTRIVRSSTPSPVGHGSSPADVTPRPQSRGCPARSRSSHPVLERARIERDETRSRAPRWQSGRMANSPSGDSVTDRIVRVLETFTADAHGADRRRDRPARGAALVDGAPHRRRARRRGAARARRRPPRPPRPAAVGARPPRLARRCGCARPRCPTWSGCRPASASTRSSRCSSRTRRCSSSASRTRTPAPTSPASPAACRCTRRRRGSCCSPMRRRRPAASACSTGPLRALAPRDDHGCRAPPPHARRGAPHRRGGRAGLDRGRLDRRRRAGPRRTGEVVAALSVVLPRETDPRAASRPCATPRPASRPRCAPTAADPERRRGRRWHSAFPMQRESRLDAASDSGHTGPQHPTRRDTSKETP